MARPKKEIDWEVAEQAAIFFCTGEEIASLCKVNYDTLVARIKEQGYDSFSEWYEEKSVITIKSLRRKQIDLAMKGDRVMLIWLGKQLLNQKEKHDIETTDKKVYVNVFDNENPLRKDTEAS